MRGGAWLSGVLLVLTLLVGPAPAQASLVTVEPDFFPDGTDLSGAFPGVTLVAIGQGDLSVYSLENPLASTGSRVFGNTDDGDEWGDGFNAGMRASFAVPVSFVAIDMIANDLLDVGLLTAYDSFGIVLDRYTTDELRNPGTFETAAISRPAADISYVIATGSEFESVSLDHLRYRVPEPGTLLLLGSGLAALGLLRRRLRRKD